MKKISSNELRNAWKEFYIKRGHVDVGAVSLVSDGSTGVMFNVAGMQPLMPYLLGKEHPLGTRLCNVQGCVRTIDIDSVGDTSHGTFFEMMGSWSLGDYFKEERCKWSFELLTEVFGFDVDHLAATVFAGDEDAPRDEEGAKYRIASGFKTENVYYLPKEHNWWGLEFGPCGPDSEMFYINDVEPCGPDCNPGCDCGRFTEIGNDVFMQYEKHQDGHLTPLEKKNVDTGWGLERNLAFLNGTSDVYKTDFYTSVISYIENKSGIKYDSEEKSTRSMRIIADHCRTSVMLIGDPAKLRPSNAGAGYVLRRLIRRAVRHGRTLKLNTEDYINIACIFIDEVYKESYPLLTENRDFVLSELKKEIERFQSTLENGMKEFKKILDTKKESGSTVISGKEAFYLYDTFGFPIELTVEMAEEEGMTVSEEEFKDAMEEQKQKARANASFSQKSLDEDVFESLGSDVTTEFVGYDTLEAEEKIVAVADENAMVDELNSGDKGTVVFAVTPFYATMGGQKGDIGTITTNTGVFEVEDTVKLPENRVGHVGHVVSGTIKTNDNAKLSVDKKTRSNTCKNHSATHLLQAALKEVLGDHVEQQGSYQDSDRTRFDFSHSESMTAEQINEVEKIVNAKIAEGLDVDTKVMGIEEAKNSGAMALFGEKYGDSVRVVSMGDFSKELCGGTHVKNTADIASFKILSENGVAAGVRRIEALTGANVLEYYRLVEENLEKAAAAAKTNASNLVEKIQGMQAQIKELSSENESLRSKLAKNSLGDVMSQVVEVKGVKLLATSVEGADMNGLRDLGDSLKEKLGEGVVVLLSSKDDKVNMIAMATDGAVKAGAHAGNLIKGIAALVGGGGGGRPNMAQAGGKNPAGIPDAIAEAKTVLENQL
ncbi:MAG: alanine--tRNA ligase [Lachnospiraceae bacterium]|nr:alanine--tRNA ligase [Lachnospiraceae bacterium]